MKHNIWFILFHISFIVLHNMKLFYTVPLPNKTRDKTVRATPVEIKFTFSSSITWYISIISPFIILPSSFPFESNSDVISWKHVVSWLAVFFPFFPWEKKKRVSWSQKATFMLKHAFLYLYIVHVHSVAKFARVTTSDLLHTSWLLLSIPPVLPPLHFSLLLIPLFTSVLYISGIHSPFPRASFVLCRHMHTNPPLLHCVFSGHLTLSGFQTWEVAFFGSLH